MVESAAAFVRMGLINQSQADELQRIGQSIEKRADELGGSYEVQFAQELYARRTTYFPEEAIDALLAATGGLRPGFRDVYLGMANWRGAAFLFGRQRMRLKMKRRTRLARLLSPAPTCSQPRSFQPTQARGRHHK